MLNPVTKARKDKKLKIAELALIAGISVARVRQIERGESAKLSGSILKALINLGYEEETITAQYEKWRQIQVTKVLQWTKEKAQG